MKLVCKKRVKDPYQELNLLKPSQILQYKAAVLAYKMVFIPQSLPEYFKSTLIKLNDVYGSIVTRSTKNKLHKSHIRTNNGKK